MPRRIKKKGKKPWKGKSASQKKISSRTTSRKVSNEDKERSRSFGQQMYYANVNNLRDERGNVPGSHAKKPERRMSIDFDTLLKDADRKRSLRQISNDGAALFREASHDSETTERHADIQEQEMKEEHQSSVLDQTAATTTAAAAAATTTETKTETETTTMETKTTTK